MTLENKKGKKYFTTQLSAEFLSLESKIDAIKRVIDKPKKYGVSAKQLELLKKQLQPMVQYAAILLERIDDFEKNY